MRVPPFRSLLGFAAALPCLVSPLVGDETAKPQVEIVRPAGNRTAQEASLQVGMAAAKVLEILGKPSEVNPLKSPSGKAEVWSYVTETELGRERIQIGAKPIKALVKDSAGRDREVVISEEPIWGTRKRVQVRTYQALLFNDQFVNDKESVQVKLVME